MLKIKTGTIDQAVSISKKIPEFINPYGEDEYKQRLEGKDHLILIAFTNNIPAGFKVGYERNGNFYSWMGGILPQYRKNKIASQLAKVQEEWARKNNYEKIFLKTLNRHKEMLLFAISNGYKIVGFEPKEIITENRIILEKQIN